MNRDDLITHFTKDSVPAWTCPTCEVSSLHFSKDNFHRFETEASLKLHAHEAWEPDWISEVFHGVLTCTNSKCKEKVLVMGKGSVRHTYLEDHYGNQEEAFVPFYYPEYFLPNLHIFKIKPSVPEEIKNILFSSFALFFCNPSSAANLARIALEICIDEIGVKKSFVSNKGKRIRISLHERINLLPAKYARERDLFMAVKWLGNAGSHKSEISNANLMDLYEIFENLLIDLFEKHDKKITRLAREVNKRKGPIKK